MFQQHTPFRQFHVEVTTDSAFNFCSAYLYTSSIRLLKFVANFNAQKFFAFTTFYVAVFYTYTHVITTTRYQMTLVRICFHLIICKPAK